MENIEVRVKPLSEIIKGKEVTYHCEKCMMNYTFPSTQNKGFECPFCHSELVKGEYKSSAVDDALDMNKKYLIMSRDANGKIIKIEHLTKEEFDKRQDENKTKEKLSKEIKETIKNVKEVSFSEISPLKDMSIEDNEVIVVVNKLSQFCGITNIVERILKSVEQRIDNEIELPFKFKYVTVVKNDSCYVDGDSKIYPQSFMFFKGTKKEYVLEELKTKDFNIDNIFDRLLYWKVIVEKGLI